MKNRALRISTIVGVIGILVTVLSICVTFYSLYYEKVQKKSVPSVLYIFKKAFKDDKEIENKVEESKSYNNRIKLKAQERSQEESKKQQESERLTKEPSEKKEEFLNRYLLNSSFLNKPESKEVAVIVIDENCKVLYNINQKIASQLKSKGINISPSFFTGYFVSDGLFNRIFNGDAEMVKKLKLLRHCDYVILGRKDPVSFIEHPEMQNLITAEVSIELHLISSKTGCIEDSISISEGGVGFSKQTAESSAMEKIFEKLKEKVWRIL